VRHAEKAENDPKDPDLAPAGRARAEALAKILKDARISAIFTTEFKRTQETAAPTSASTGVRSTIVAGKDIAALIAKLDQLSGNALVVAHGNTIPDIPDREVPWNRYTRASIRSEEAQRSALLQVFIEPGDRLVHPVGLVFGTQEQVAFAGVDDELGRDLERC